MTEITVEKKKWRAVFRVEMKDPRNGTATADITTGGGTFQSSTVFRFPEGTEGTEEELAAWIRKGLKWVAWI
jgi:hypothetical protein